MALWGLRFYFDTLTSLNWIIIVSLCHFTMDKYILKMIEQMIENAQICEKMYVWGLGATAFNVFLVLHDNNTIMFCAVEPCEIFTSRKERGFQTSHACKITPFRQNLSVYYSSSELKHFRSFFNPRDLWKVAYMSRRKPPITPM